MDRNLADKIKNKKITCVFISPHFDDAILSCGGLLSELSGKTDITIINVFTKAHKKPYTLSARKFLKNSGNQSDAILLYDTRCTEDKNALSQLRVKIINLGLEDALFRRKKQSSLLGKLIPEVIHIYPTYRWHILKAISSTDYAPKILKKILKKYSKKDVLFFAPSGIGNHADHQIIRRVSEELFDDLILYSDFPYNIREKVSSQKTKENQQIYTLMPNLFKKSRLIKLYKTQFAGLFPNGRIPKHNEIYSIAKGENI